MIRIYGKVLARILSVSTSCDCKQSCVPESPKVRLEMWFDGENESFEFIYNNILVKGMSI
jgi:hypothetical protein